MSVHDQVIRDILERKRIGLAEYGQHLLPHNGRDALQDAYEEALDMACYLKQKMLEDGTERKGRTMWLELGIAIVSLYGGWKAHKTVAGPKQNKQLGY
ncbi:hypothetical protein SEA_JONJAMES_160 [Gordonia Phage JonJames]|nr:hypothetical protein SEA_JONJAMES_160 [Gordonia Phage JonJames]